MPTIIRCEFLKFERENIFRNAIYTNKYYNKKNCFIILLRCLSLSHSQPLVLPVFVNQSIDCRDKPMKAGLDYQSFEEFVRDV